MAKEKAKPTFDHLEGLLGDNSGFEDINLQTMSIPFLRLLQSNSPQLKSSKPEYIEGSKEGMFANTVTNKLYEAPFNIVIGRFDRYFIEWGDTRGKFIAAHDPELFEAQIRNKLVRNEKNKLVDPDTGHTFVETYMYYVVLPDHMEDGICLLALSSTGIKEAKRLNRLLTHTMIPGTTKRAMPYFMVWSVNTVDMSNDEGDWIGYRFEMEDFVTQDQLEHVVEERKALPDKKPDFNQLALPEDTEEGAGSGEEPGGRF